MSDNEFDWGGVSTVPADEGTPLFDGMTPDHTASRPDPTEPVKETVRGLGTNRAARGGPRRTRPGELAETAELPYTLIGFGFDMIGDETCGTAFKDNAESLGLAWDAAAQENDAVRRALLWLREGGVWTRIVVAHAPLVGAILGHHGVPVRIPPAFFGATTEDETVVSMPS